VAGRLVAPHDLIYQETQYPAEEPDGSWVLSPESLTEEAGMGGARVGSAGLEDLRVRTGQDVGHHATGREAHDVDARTVGAVAVNGVVDHADDAEGVAAAVVRKAGGVVHIPAVALVRGAGVDQDEAVLVSILGETGPAEPLLGVAAARVELREYLVRILLG
jgi:hypothetical protein